MNTNQVIENAAEESQQGFEQAERTAEGLAAKVRHKAEQVSDEVRQRAEQVRQSAGEAVHRGEEYVRENPVPVVIGALAVGVVIGAMFAFGRRDEITARERYLDEPMHHARDVLYGVLAPVAKELRDRYGAVRSSANAAADRLHEFDPADSIDPLLKQARRFSKRLKFW
jgi:ElaB/YqjD/DUF883 family membrane-anchored ribosome-binding protein